MPRIKINLPEQFYFSTQIPIRITDINYGGHVGNDNILSLIHEARVLFLKSKGYEELDIEGLGLIMSDVAIEFKNELFYGDTITAWVTTAEFSKVAFEMYYKLEKRAGGKMVTVVVAKTGMVCYDYAAKKIAALPEKARQTLQG